MQVFRSKKREDKDYNKGQWPTGESFHVMAEDRHLVDVSCDIVEVT